MLSHVSRCCEIDHGVVIALLREKELALQRELLLGGMSRDECAWYIGATQWPMRHHSSCVMCPNMSAHEWRVMATENGEDWRRAVELDQYIRRVNPDVYVHPKCEPLEVIYGNC